MPDLIEAEADGVLTLTLNRPERLNALSDEMLALLMAALARAAVDPAVGAVVLTGAGRGFCAGGDVKAMAAQEEVPLEIGVETLRAKHRVIELIRFCPKIVVGMLNGAAFGAGFAIALACDLRLAGSSARFGTAFAQVGFSGDFGGSYFLTSLVGPAKARELYFLAEPFHAAQALALGLVTRVVADADLAGETMALARRMAAGPRVAFGYMKRNLMAAETASLREVLDQEALHQTRCRMTADHREATRAFVEKRAPRFTGT